jgi:class 3 adenylate cyclase
LLLSTSVGEESDGDLMGDGVNIAERLEGVAKPGTICLSEDAARPSPFGLQWRSSLLAAHIPLVLRPVAQF